MGVCVGVWLIVYVGGWCTHGSRRGVVRIWLGWGCQDGRGCVRCVPSTIICILIISFHIVFIE